MIGNWLFPFASSRLCGKKNRVLEKKMKNAYRILGLVSILSILSPYRLLAAVEHDALIPQVSFAAQEITAALKEAGRENLQVELKVQPDEASLESFEIRSAGANQIMIIGSDAKGAMYGGLEVAELIRMKRPIKSLERKPFVKKRGIKFNIPWDARTPSYDDTGDNAQKSVAAI